MNIDELKPGRELDALVAEKVFGVDVGDIYYDSTMQEITNFSIPHYSTDISAAWEVVEKFGRFDLILNGSGAWCAEFYGSWDRSFGDSAPHAICLAALKAAQS